MVRFFLSLFIFILYNSFIIAQDAVYSLDFISNWNERTHPTDYPGAAHWSSLIGTTHNVNISFWDFGQLASQGVEDVAEDGVTINIKDEFNIEITNGNAYEVIELPLGFGDLFTFEGIEVDKDFPYISLMTMLAPSPDWLAEIHNVKLTDDFGNWKTLISIPVYATDAGTDDGPTYIYPDTDTNPPENISSLEDVLPFSNQIIATFVFDLTQILSVDKTKLQNSISIHPNPSHGEININNLGSSILENIEIYDITGKKVMEFNNVTNQKTISFNALKSGMYFLKINSDKGSIIKKIIIK